MRTIVVGESVGDLVDRFRDTARGHPAQALLFQAKANRLDDASVAKVCTPFP